MTTEQSDFSGDALLPDELLAANHRRAAHRAKTARGLSRSRARRRILPTVMVTSVAIVGAGVANAFVNSTIVPTTTTTSPAAAINERQNAANAKTLARVSAALAADRQTLAALMRSAATARAQATSGAAATSGSSSSVGVVSVPSAAAPVIATPAPAPAPVVHTTTGASGAG